MNREFTRKTNLENNYFYLIFYDNNDWGFIQFEYVEWKNWESKEVQRIQKIHEKKKFDNRVDVWEALYWRIFYEWFYLWKNKILNQ